MMIILYIVIVILFVVAFLALIGPKTYTVHRSIVINKPLPDVFNYIKMIKNQDYWSPWKNKDPNMKQESVGTDGEVGFIAKWEGNKEVGSGEQEIKRIVENEIIESQLRFFKPWKSQSEAFIAVNKKDTNSTQVTWGFSGVNKIPFNIFFLFFSMDKTVGRDFEDGLEKLKELLEK